MLNSGYYSMPPETFSQLLLHYAQNDTSQIESVVCLTVNFTTNGFSHWLNSRFFPSEGGLPVERRLGKGFGAAVGEFMTNWSRKGFQSEGELAPVAVPIAFKHEGVFYRYFPESLPPRWTPESMMRE